MKYTHQYYATFVVAFSLLALGAVQGLGGEALGLSPRVMAWIGVVSSVAGGVALWLPKITRPPDQDREGQD